MSRVGADEAPEMAHSADVGQARKKKPLACKRCRQRKQKCTDVRPCENCTQSGAECIPTESAVAPKQVVEPDYVQRLEERVAELEALIPRESVDHVNATHDRAMPPMSQLGSQNPPFPPPPPPGHPAVHSHHWPGSPGSPLDTLSHGLHGVVADINAQQQPHVLLHTRAAHSEPPPVEAPYVAPDMEHFLVRTYFDMAQSQYPVLLPHEFLQWVESWSLGTDVLQASTRWKGFFVYMVYAIAFLMTKSRISGPTRSREFFALATSRYLPYALEHPSMLLRAQALLLLTIYALHIPARDPIIALSSRAIRFCVENQLHLAEAEPPATDAAALVEIQLRRRIFWCAYALDRVVCGSHDLPLSVADHHITVPLFDNIDDDQLHSAVAPRGASQSPRPPALPVSRAPTSVSSALHVIKGRQIESEIQDALLRRDFAPTSAATYAWRARVLGKLKAWNARSRLAAEPSHKGYASLRWHKMIYYYDIVTLYGRGHQVDGHGDGHHDGHDLASPDDVDHPTLAGNLIVQAGCQALLLFRRFQMAREIAQPWLGLLSQFQIGVTLLYCFFCTPPCRWPAAYRSTDVPDAVRACSSTLAVLAERWAEAECLRDVFEVLAREVPFGASWERPRRISDEGRATVAACWPAVARIVMDRPTLGMVRAMANDELVQEDDVAGGSHPGSQVGNGSDAHDAQAGRDTIVVGAAAAAAAAAPHATSADLFDGMDLEWAHLTHASSLEMEAQFYLPSEMETTLEEAHLMLGWMNGASGHNEGRGLDGGPRETGSGEGAAGRSRRWEEE